MKRKISFHSSVGFGVATLLAVPVVLAQMGSGQGRQMPKYDPATEVTVKGTVEEVQEGMMQPGHMQQMGSMGQMGQMGHMGLHLVLKTESASYTVLVGPTQYVKDKGFTFEKGDTVQVTGSKVKYGEGEALIAREITKGGKVLTLRNEQGIPKWSRGPRA
ncbi:MAG TPA: hypothetical protein VLX32_01215 [Candidatus Acidoferrum sp.]|nr:hypothetical protein [Candidatus Acidoferrum sp.]